MSGSMPTSAWCELPFTEFPKSALIRACGKRKLSDIAVPVGVRDVCPNTNVRQPMTLPDEYVRYCTGDGPKEGGLSVDPGWFQLWPLADSEQLNRDYRVVESVPRFVAFGTNGGGELLAFDPGGRVFMIPFVPMSAEDARPVAASWSEFVAKIEK